MQVDKKLKLIAKTNKDLKIISYLSQDAIFTKDELFFDETECLFLATFSRYCWDRIDNSISKDHEINYRVVSGLQIRHVKKVNYLNFSEISEINFLNLLVIENKKNVITLHFSNSVQIVLLIDKINILLEDIDIPWPTKLKPHHKFD